MEYRRMYVPGGTYFFTVVTHGRRPILTSPLARAALQNSLVETRLRRPFELVAIVLLPDHLHCIWTLPDDDRDDSTRWRKLKEGFTRSYLADGGTEGRTRTGQRRKGLRAVFQPRFWEHTVRDERDFACHANYIHFDPVKHRLARCAHDWKFSSFERYVREGIYDSS